ncbi:MAG: tol-pal system protein YbgF [Deltaproteobacteria bacterium RIFOXYD12_FULL_57_12]|nr:MAG: tol-pal system protein YbgF [Deltaproteobacteria bacterium RIFOXYD12_FULL_57_12]
MKKYFHLLLILCLTPFLQNCATTQDVQSTNLRVLSVDQRVKELKDNTVKQVQTQQAKVDNTIDNLQTQILNLQGQLEESAHKNRVLHEENKEILAGLRTQVEKQTQMLAGRIDKQDERITQLENKITQVEIQISQTETAIEDIKQRRAKDAAERATEAAKAAEKAGKDKGKDKTRAKGGAQEIQPDQYKKKAGEDDEADAKESKDDPGQALYDKALDLFRDKKYQEAHETFTSYLAKHPDGKMKANARFWVGDCLYNQQEFELAILEYQKVIADYPKHAKAPAALLKQGLSFEKIKDKDTAKMVFQKLLADYPDSDQKEAAQKRLDALK